MLRRVGETVDSKDAVVKIKDASFPTPFVSALEYNSPVHGNWNIVHTGMQVPESIQIYVCADNCMREEHQEKLIKDAEKRLPSRRSRRQRKRNPASQWDLLPFPSVRE